MIPPPPHNRTETSKAAAAAIDPVAGTIRARCLDFIKSQGDEGATADECEVALSIRGRTVTPRFFELERSGLITKTDARRRTISGRMAAVYRAAKGST